MKDRLSSKSQSKSSVLIVCGAVVALAIIGFLAFIFGVPRYSILINDIGETSRTSQKNFDIIKGTVKVKCNARESNGNISCDEATITGKYDGNRKVKVVFSDGIYDQEVNDKTFSFKAMPPTYKDVVIRDPEVKGDQQKKISVSLHDTNDKKVLQYELTVDYQLSGDDLAKLNGEPATDRIAAALVKIPGVSGVCVANEDNDPNGVLGKQGQYYAKVVFVYDKAPKVSTVYDENIQDSRAPRDTCEMGVEAGGSVEVFRNAEDAKKRIERFDSLRGTLMSNNTLDEQIGKVVIRATGEIKASQQVELLNAMKEVLTR